MSTYRDGTGDEILVVNRRHGLPYSRGLMAQSMMAAGLAPASAYEIAREVQERLVRARATTVAVAELRRTVGEVLAEREGERALTRYRHWEQLHRADPTVIVLVGGATGTGKSTLASLLAHQLGINRVAATDMVRQVLRACFAEPFMPAVHVSSFEVGRVIRLRAHAEEDPELVGFLRQVDNVATGVRALLERTIVERTPMILEGVHLVPGLLPDLGPDALIVPVVIAVSDEERHRAHLSVRGGISSRPAERYLRRFATIRKLQRFIVEHAERSNVPVLDNVDTDRSVEQLSGLVLDALAAHARRRDQVSAD